MIKDLKKDNLVLGFFAVKEIDEKETKDHKKFIDITLVDISGQINAKIWEIEEAIFGERPKKGNIVKVDGVVQEFKGAPQIKINKIRKDNENDKYDPQTIIPAAPTPPEIMWDTLMRFADAISNNKLKVAIKKVLEQHKSKLMYYPGAKTFHHSYKCGLLEHITTMLLSGEKLAPIYLCNTDILYAGIILHDIGKLYELITDETAMATEYTLEGEMLGHIGIGLQVIDTMEGLNAEQKILLKHMIFSHHQSPEMGSPKRPMFREAELLHYLDILDARMFDFGKALTQTAEGTLSAKVFTLDNRRVYSFTKQTEEE